MSRFLSKRVARVPSSGIRKFFDIAATMPDVISLGIGEPDFITPVPIVNAGIDSLRDGHTSYTSNSGLFELREAVAGYLEKLYGIAYDPETEVLITVGVSEAMNLAMICFVNPGDEVIMAEPAFVAYAADIALAAGKPIQIPTSMDEDFQVNPDAIERAITPRTKAILIGYPNNPTGGVLSKDRLIAIAELAEKYDLVVISDEIYDRLTYGVDHIHFAALPDMKKRTVVLGGFSKSHAMTGWRLGYAVGDPDLIAGMRKVHQYSIMSAPTTAQYAGLKALSPEGEEAVQQMVCEYNRRRELMYQGFNAIGLPCFEPKGAFYAFPRISDTGMNEYEFCDKLLEEEHVAMIPGSAFGPSGEGFIRASYASAYESLEEALTRIERFVKRHT